MTKQPTLTGQREAFERWRAAFMEAIDGEHPSAWDAWQAAAARYEGVVEAARKTAQERGAWELRAALAALDGEGK